MTDEGPTAQRRRLGIELKKCREHAGLTQEQVATHFEWHSAKVTRIETARVGVSPRDVKDMLTLYGVQDDQYRDALSTLARRSKQRTWWTDYKDILRTGNFIGLEAEATSLRVWSPVLIPGLLQTPDYARALYESVHPTPDPDSIERRVTLRLTRQERLTIEPLLHLSAIIDESVLHRVVGGNHAMHAQLGRLLEAGSLPNVNVQILPLDAGEHMLMGGPAELLEFPAASDMDVVYLEGLAGDYFEERHAEVARYRRIFERLSANALSRRASAKLITETLARYDDGRVKGYTAT